MGIEVRTGFNAAEITDGGVIAADGAFLPAKTVVWAKGERADHTLFNALNERIDEVYLVGDVQSPRKVFNAVREAYYIVANID